MSKGIEHFGLGEDGDQLHALLLRAGMGIEEANVTIRSTFLSLARPPNRAERAMSEIGVSPMSMPEVRSLGLTGVLKGVVDKANGDGSVVAHIFPDIRALIPTLIDALKEYDGDARL